jgi:hypothetical protein
MAGEGMVRSPGEVHREAVSQRVVARLQRAPHGAQRALHQLGRPGKPKPPHLGGLQLAVREAPHVAGGVHAQQLLLRRAPRVAHPLGRHDPLRDHGVAQQGVLGDGKAVAGGEGKGVARGGPDGEQKASIRRTNVPGTTYAVPGTK